MKTAGAETPIYRSRKRVISLVFCAAALVLNCTPVRPQPPAAADCTAVCSHGAEMACAWASPTPNGVTCVQVCEDANTILPWSSECLASAATCEEADRCR